MSRSSTVTARQQPVARSTSASGPVAVCGDTFVVGTERRLQVIDLTERVMAFVHGLGIREGLVNLFPLHTTCGVLINEHQAALVADIERFLEYAVPPDADWLHDDPAHSDCGRANADAHLRALVVGHSLTLQVSGGELVLGQWQRVLLAELDGPRERSIRAVVMGVQ
jgi:secondary thiamine-phosphate synthase enzyme